MQTTKKLTLCSAFVAMLFQTFLHAPFLQPPTSNVPNQSATSISSINQKSTDIEAPLQRMILESMEVKAISNALSDLSIAEQDKVIKQTINLTETANIILENTIKKAMTREEKPQQHVQALDLRRTNGNKAAFNQKTLMQILKKTLERFKEPRIKAISLYYISKIKQHLPLLESSNTSQKKQAETLYAIKKELNSLSITLQVFLFLKQFLESKQLNPLEFSLIIFASDLADAIDNFQNKTILFTKAIHSQKTSTKQNNAEEEKHTFYKGMIFIDSAKKTLIEINKIESELSNEAESPNDIEKINSLKHNLITFLAEKKIIHYQWFINVEKYCLSDKLKQGVTSFILPVKKKDLIVSIKNFTQKIKLFNSQYFART